MNSNQVIANHNNNLHYNNLHDRKSHVLDSSSITLHDKNDVDIVKQFAYAVCREYLSGAWKNIQFEDLIIQRLSGGLSNYLYKCEITKDKFKQVDNEPCRILLRLYGENHHKNSSIILKDVVVSAIMSDNCIGPKLYGLFPAGRLEEFINATCMDQNDMYIPELSSQIARVMAKFHTLEMPFIKEPHWLFDTTTKYMKQANEVTFTSDNDIKNFSILSSYNMEDEYRQLKKFLVSLNSPVVFCHNDINVGNILKLNDKLMVIDYEYGSYNYRGFDIGNHFCEWMFNNNYENHPYFQYNYELYPNKEQQINFLNAYIEQYKQTIEQRRKFDDDDIETEDKENKNNYFQSKNLNIENLMIEANCFALASHVFWYYWSICQASVCKIKFEYLEYAMARCDAYFKQKKLLFPDGFKQD